MEKRKGTLISVDMSGTKYGSIPYWKLKQNAWEWWSEQGYDFATKVVVDEYMKEMCIHKKDVDFNAEFEG